ncbi:alpha/beta hydrolase [Echinicola jeungdonensis]|uniref:Alpha/beta hydrolase fold domain-containing protein n=1 Tax=Echinicola jeungdonensis TaxID=709343 RepID=A0ABV5J383_9BACT|nr:alpha/beta hydrolase [Echinicola jeungdonensis]MDN3668915.1 alpha/beta hydrolase [Echinicola jeungdonensis]
MKLNLLLTALFISLCCTNGWSQQKTIPRDTSYNAQAVWEKIKGDFPQAKLAKDELPEGVREDRDVVYTVLKDTPYGDRPLHLDIFYPESSQNLPVILLIHGGGWRSGDKSLQVPMAKKLAKKGFVTICVEYQLSLEAKYPAAVHNIKSAIRWTRAHADQYGINPDRIAISGCSAGGQLASLVGLTNNVDKMEGKQGWEEYSSEVQAIMDIDGAINFLAPLSLKSPRSPDSPDAFWLGGTFTQVPAIWKEASPGYWVDENSVPTLFVNSGFPRFHAGQAEMVEMLEDYGIYHEVYEFDVKMHPFWLFEPWVDTTVGYMDGFLKKVFAEDNSN